MEKFTSKTAEVMFLIVLSAFMAVNSLATDVYLPALPVMAGELGAGSEFTITGYLLGFMIAQLVWGPISDKIGRIKPLIAGSVIFVLGTVGCAMSTSMPELVCWRVFQATGACVGPMLSRAMIRDVCTAKEAADKLSLVTMIMAVAPIAGPLLGGVIVVTFSWQMIFYAVACIGAAIGLMIHVLPETLPENRRQSTSMRHVFNIYGMLIKDFTFMKYTLCIAMFYMAAYAVIAGTPFMYITYYGIPEVYYGLLFGLNVIGVMVVSFFNRHLLRLYTLDVLLKYSTGIASLAVVLLVFFVKTTLLGVYGVVGAIILMFSMNGIIAACSTAAALDHVGDKAGTAAALIGSLQYGSGIISTFFLGLINNHTPWPMLTVIVAGIFCCTILAWMPQGRQPSTARVLKT